MRSNVGGVDVDHGALPVVLSFDWLAFTASCRGAGEMNTQTTKMSLTNRTCSAEL